MNNIQIITKNPFISGKLFTGPPARTNYLWENLVVENSISINWINKLYKDSVFNDFWSVLSSPVS